MSTTTTTPSNSLTVRTLNFICTLSAKLCVPSLGVVALAIGFLSGCAESDPFPLAQISGKVTYPDGSLVEASRIQIICLPMDAESQGKKSPRGAKGSVDPSTGEFANLTTWKTGDGVICGRNKVAIVPIRVGKDTDNMGRPDRKAVDRKFFSTKSTKLEIEVVSGGENYFELTVERPGK